MPEARFTPVEMLRRLVAFDTTSVRSNLALIDWVADYLDGQGIGVTLTHDDRREKANLFATLAPASDESEGGVLLSGHTDVVPVAGQPWDSDPFALCETETRLYARGSADMKGFIAIALALVPEFRARTLRRPIHLALTYDEEVGCFGAPRLLAGLPADRPRPSLAIIGEPTGMKVVNANKGCHILATTVTGLEGHASAPERGVSAIFAASEVVGRIAALAAERRRAAQPQSGFDPPYTTFNIGAIEGGTAPNIIARRCRFTWEFRPLPGPDPEDRPERIRGRIDGFIAEDLLPRLRHVHPGSTVETEALCNVPALQPEPDSPAEALARRLTGVNESGTVAFATEGGLYQAAGIPTVICGPGSIDQAHQPNEFIARDQIEAGTRFLRDLAAWAAG